MIASSSTFFPHSGRVIRDLFCQLHAVWHGTEALVYSNHPREAAASSYQAIIFGWIASGVHWFFSSTAVLMQPSHQCWAGVGCGSLKQPAIACLKLGLSRGVNGSTQRELSFLLLLWGLSDPRIAELCEMPRSFSIKLHSETGCSGMSGGRSLRHAQNPLSGERWEMLSITHHALSPPPSHHHLYIISSHQLTTTFLSYYNVT